MVCRGCVGVCVGVVRGLCGGCVVCGGCVGVCVGVVKGLCGPVVWGF